VASGGTGEIETGGLTDSKRGQVDGLQVLVANDSALSETSRTSKDGEEGREAGREEDKETALTRATLAYFDGDWQGALDILEGLVRQPSRDRRLETLGYLITAAANYQLYRRSGQVDEVLLSRAQSAVNTVRLLQPGFQPDPALFSPSFVALFASAEQ
jgi:hypothetical protein